MQISNGSLAFNRIQHDSFDERYCIIVFSQQIMFVLTNSWLEPWAMH